MKMWIDTEFNEYKGALISLALVAEDGREWYGVRRTGRAPGGAAEAGANEPAAGMKATRSNTSYTNTQD